MLVYCSSALFNKLMFWGLYWHLTAWLELMWLKSWKNTMGCLSPLPKIPVGEEGLGNTWADLYSVVQLFQWNAHKTTFEAWGLLTLTWASLESQSEQIAGLFYVCEKHWSAVGSAVGAAFWSSVFRREMHVSASLVLVSSLEKNLCFSTQVSDLAVPDHSLPIKGFLSQWKVRLLLTKVLNKIFAVILIRSFTDCSSQRFLLY